MKAVKRSQGYRIQLKSRLFNQSEPGYQETLTVLTVTLRVSVVCLHSVKHHLINTSFFWQAPIILIFFIGSRTNYQSKRAS